MKKKVMKLGINTLAIVLAAVMWLPIFWTAVVSIKPKHAPVFDITRWFEPPFTLENFEYVFNNPQADMIRWLLNSFTTSLIGTAGVVALSLLAAYAFSRFQFPGRKILFWVCLSGMMIPGESLMIPQYLLFRDWSLLNTFTCIILPGLGSSMGLLILKQFIDGIPESLFDAAKIDGCNSLRMLVSIVTPLTKAAISTLTIFTFRLKWNDYLWPYISISDPDIMTIPVGIDFFRGQYQDGYSYQMAANMIAILPVLVIFLIFQKNIVKGIALSGMKE